MSNGEIVIRPAKRNLNTGKNVWRECSKLVSDYKPINLGLGYPDCPSPKFVTDAFVKTAASPNFLLHQYSRSMGHKRLVDAIATLYSKVTNINIDPMSDVIVSTGASGVLYTTLHAFVDANDEVILIEPFFDMYEKLVEYVGGVSRFISLKPLKSSGDVMSSRDWSLDMKELESLFNSRTKAIILNNPSNPLGKVYSRTELEQIAELCRKWNVLCISDEVYEWLIYKGEQHIRMCTLPGMWERTITIGSAGKAFSVTGWKIGWAYGHTKLIEVLQTLHLVACATPLQEAAAVAFEHEIQTFGTDESYFNMICKELIVKRDFTVNFLQNAGMHCYVPQGGYFVLADWSDLEAKVDLSSETDSEKDYRFIKWLTKNLSVLGLPTSAFFSEKNKSILSHGIRVCFFKDEHTLDEAASKFIEWKKTL